MSKLIYSLKNQFTLSSHRQIFQHESQKGQEVQTASQDIQKEVTSIESKLLKNFNVETATSEAQTKIAEIGATTKAKIGPDAKDIHLKQLNQKLEEANKNIKTNQDRYQKIATFVEKHNAALIQLNQLSEAINLLSKTGSPIEKINSLQTLEKTLQDQVSDLNKLKPFTKGMTGLQSETVSAFNSKIQEARAELKVNIQLLDADIKSQDGTIVALKNTLKSKKVPARDQLMDLWLHEDKLKAIYDQLSDLSLAAVRKTLNDKLQEIGDLLKPANQAFLSSSDFLENSYDANGSPKKADLPEQEREKLNEYAKYVDSINRDMQTLEAAIRPIEAAAKNKNFQPTSDQMRSIHEYTVWLMNRVDHYQLPLTPADPKINQNLFNRLNQLNALKASAEAVFAGQNEAIKKAQADYNQALYERRLAQFAKNTVDQQPERQQWERDIVERAVRERIQNLQEKDAALQKAIIESNSRLAQR